MTSDVCIVGGGPAGLAAAIALGRSGRSVSLLDCAIPPIDKACGEGLMPDSLQALSHLGVLLSKEVGHPFRGIKFIGTEVSATADFPVGIGRGVRRSLLHKALIEQAERTGVRMFWGVKDVRTKPGLVSFNTGEITTALLVGADGQHSKVRRDAGLQAPLAGKRRFGFRRHYRVKPWSDFVEVYWGAGFQIYVTPVAADLVCVALLSRDATLRLDKALAMLPGLRDRLLHSRDFSVERGSISASRRFPRVHGPGVVLVGDASGSVDSITGEGMGLAFSHALALVEALDAGDLRLYGARHRVLSRRPLQMARLLLLLDRSRLLQRKALKALSSNPPVFASMLAAHVGHASMLSLCSPRMVGFGLELLAA